MPGREVRALDRVRRIELLVRAAEAGSFAKAARLLGLDPSAVSHAIAELEKELRLTLFYRTTRQLRLTEDGEEVYRRGTEIMHRLADLEGAASKAPEVLTGTLRVGLSVTMSRAIVMPRLSEFIRRHPGLKLEFLVLTQMKDMHASGVDVMLRAEQPAESGVIARKLVDVKFGVYASPKYLQSAGEPATPQDLVRHRCLIFITPHDNKQRNEWLFERDGQRTRVRVPSTIVTDEREGLIAAAVAGCGLMWTGLFDPALVTSGQLRKVLPEWSCPLELGFYALYRRTPRVPAKIAAFIDFVADAFAAFDPNQLTVIHNAKPDRRGRRA
jgi:DNA-binding transcriptional LysR family regulator